MFKNLSPGAIGISVSFTEAIELAKKTGFEGIDVSIGNIADLVEKESADYVKSMFEDAGIKPGGWGLPVNWRGEESELKEDLEKLPRLAKVGQEIGCTRVPTWVMSFSDERPFEENFEWHKNRFRQIAEILKDYDCSLGLEFLGPKTIREGHKYEFIHTMEGMLELCDAIGTGNVGLLLDCWHWYTSGGTLEDMEENLTSAEQVVYVHVNDAPKGIPIDEQIDNIRRLPGETGVIDLAGFLKALDKIGYEGPVTPEPFSEKLKEIDEPEEAALVTIDGLNKAWREAGLE